MVTILQDLRYGFRTMLKSPGFALIAIATLALGIGANTAMFTIVNAVLLRPIPYPHPERLLKLATSMPQFRDASISYPNFLDWQRRSRSFEQMAAYRHDSFNLTGQATPERVRGLMASSTLFSVLDLNPNVGRVFTADEDRRGGNPVVVLTSNYWKTRFGGDPGIVGRTLTLNEKLYTVVGVVPSDDVILQHISLMTPIGQWTEPLFWDRSVGMNTRGVARLKPEVTPQQAQSELNGIAAGLASEFPKENKNHGIFSVPLREDLLGEVRTPLLLLLGAVGFVLLIACANVANLMLSRSAARRREFAIRGALGATRSRIIRQTLTEGLSLSLIGGAIGLAIAPVLSSLFSSKITDQLPRADQIHLDLRVLAFTAGISILASLIFGITPALQSSRSDLNETLKEVGRGNAGRHSFQRVLVVTEVALALLLTASAGLMMRTMSNLLAINPGFDPQNVLTFSIAGSKAVHGSPAAVRAGFTETMDQLRSIPGVKAASLLIGGMPMNGDSELPYWVEGRPKPAETSQMDMALFYAVDADYLNVMRIPLLRGRFLSPQDNENSPCVMDIDEDFARTKFPGQDPIGQHINLELVPMKCEVVGVVGHVKHWGLDRDATSKIHSQMYLSLRQFPDSVMDLASTGSDCVIRTAGDPYSVVPTLKRTVTQINGKMVSYDEESMDDLIKDSLATRRFTRLLLGVFALLALVLAVVGIYGVVSYAVTQSTREIGIRMALGADTRSVVAMVLSSAMRMAIIGILIGAVAAVIATRVMKNLLYGVSSADPLTFVLVAVILAAVAAVASYIPAYRATKIDPVVALRYE
jgi:predicted permease